VALGYAATQLVPACQVPPRGLWGGSGQSRWVALEAWLGQPLSSGSAEDLVLRYLGAFDPASVADVQLWSGLRRLAEVVDLFGVDGGAAPLPRRGRPARVGGVHR
jgi:hypothetical protein